MPRRSSKGARKQPPPFVVTSQDAEDALRLRAERARAERILRKTGDSWRTLAELGISRPSPDPTTRGGRRPVSSQELEDLAGLYINMRSWPLPDDPPERLARLRM